MTRNSGSFGPHTTLPLADSFYFERFFQNLRGNRIKKKPELSKLSIVTRASVCSTKGTTKSGKERARRFGEKRQKSSKSKNNSINQRRLTGKQSKWKRLESSSFDKNCSEQDKSKQTLERRHNLSSCPRQTGKSTRRNPPSEYLVQKTKNPTCKLKNMNTTTKLNCQKNRRTIQSRHADYFRCPDRQISNMSFETLMKTGCKAVYCQDRCKHSNDHLYSSAIINKPLHREDLESLKADTRDDCSIQSIDRKVRDNQSFQIQQKSLNEQRDYGMKNLHERTQKVLTGYKEECSRLKKQRDRYKTQYLKVLAQLRKLIK